MLGDLQVQVARPSYDTFLKQTVGIAIAEDCLVVAAPSAFAAEYLGKRMKGVVQRAIERVSRVPMDVRFEVQAGERAVGVAGWPSVAGVDEVESAGPSAGAESGRAGG